MARTKGSANFAGSLEVLAGAPLDARSVVPTKADLTAEGNFPYKYVGMEVYVTAENKKYRLINADPTSLESWEEIGGSSIEVDDEMSLTSENPVQNKVITQGLTDVAKEINDNIATGNNAYTDILVELLGKVSNLEDNIKYNIDEYLDASVVITNGHYKKDFLPDHERVLFCTSLDFSYTANFSTSGNDELKINNKIINIPVQSGTQTIIIKVVCDGMNTKIYSNDILLEENNDSIILTIEITSLDTQLSVGTLKYTMGFVPYTSVNVEYPYPIFERRQWEGVPDVVIINGSSVTVPAAVKTALQATYPYEPSIYYCTNPFANINTNFEAIRFNNYCAQYAIGEITPTSISGGWQANSYENQVIDIYMANWDLSNTTTVQNLFEWTANNFAERGYNRCRRVDYTKLNLKNLTGNYLIYPRFNMSVTKGIFINAVDMGKITRLYMPQSFAIESVGDLSAIDISNLTSIQDLFMGCLRLKYVGDISKWNVTSKITNTKALFRQCYNLRGISKNIGKWDISGSTNTEMMFLDAMYMGDSEFELLDNWNTQNVTEMTGMFAYGEIPGKANQDFENLYIKNWGKKPDIVSKRTDLSFIENWNVSKVTTLYAFAQNNPYLINIGDLRNWNVASLTDIHNFLLNCSALETFQMPSIPRGTIVDDIVKGCTSLANIEIDELNVAAISFEDCPLTKQSVLNLINAATDEVEITLNPTVYAAVISDADVTAAIATKASAGINVTLKEATV